MKFCTYSSTPELDRFPIEQRYRVWRATHKQLMGADPEYHRAVRRFLFQIIASTLVCVIITPAIVFLEYRVHDNPAFMVFSIVIPLAVYVEYTFFVVYASFGIQRFQNEKVAEVLQKAI
jgi:hypothetical protein